MADSPQFTNYQINATTLNIMKEASGNYMPDYGHWRMRFGEGDIPDRAPAPAPQPEAAPVAPAGDSAKRAEAIVKLIRSRQAK